MSVRLIATDLDSTLLDSDGGVSPRTRAALDAATAAGIHVVPATARNPVGLRHLRPVLGLDEWALCSNGSFGIHLTTRELLFADEVTAPVIAGIVTVLDTAVRGVRSATPGNGSSPRKGTPTWRPSPTTSGTLPRCTVRHWTSSPGRPR